MSLANTQNSPEVVVEGQQSFQYLRVVMPPNSHILSESGAMCSMDSGIDLRAKLNGGFFRALLLNLLGGESFFISRYTNTSAVSQTLCLTQAFPGQIVFQELKGGQMYLQGGSYIASTEGISLKLNWAGFASWLGGEGFFRLSASGHGTVWYGSFGAVYDHEVKGSFIVDSGHLLSLSPQLKIRAGLAGGIFSSFFGGEGIVLKIYGQGWIRLQTRSVSGLAQWLNRFFY